MLDGLRNSKGLPPSMHYVSCVLYHAANALVVELEESSVKVEYQSSDTQELPYPNSLGDSGAENSD